MTGGFEPINPTLTSQVCGACNQALGNTIDLGFSRGYWEGMSRFRHNLKSISEAHELSRNNIDFEVADPEAFRSEVGEFTDVLRDHLRLEFEDGKIVRLTTQQLLNKPLEELVDLSHVAGFRVFAETDEGDREIGRLVVPILSAAGFEITEGLLKHQVTAKVTYDVTSFRAIAKIAFNYLAKVTVDAPDIVLSEQFDEIRSFIRYGHIPSFLAVQHNPERNKFIYGDTALNGHWITLEISANIPRTLTVRLSLFNGQTWTVILTPNYTGPIDRLSSSHIWDLKTRRCERVTGILPTDLPSIRDD